MKILFVYNDINVKGGARSYHFGVGILSAVLKARGHSTRLFYDYETFNLPGFLAAVKEYGPDLVAFTSDYTQFSHVQRMSAELKKTGYRGLTIAGGPHPSLYPDCLQEAPGLDAICIGEGEGAISDVAERLERRQPITDVSNLWVRTPGGIVRNPPRPFIADLDTIPFGDRELFDYQKIIDSDFDRALFMLSRGCPFNCTYCGSPAMGKLQQGKYVRFRSVDNGLDEVAQVLGRYRVSSLFFADDVFTMDKTYVAEFARKYKERFAIPFEITTRVESSSYEMFAALKEAGCWRVAIGIESGSETFRRERLNRRMSNEEIKQAFADARRAGLLTKSYNIVGFPFETWQLYEETVRLNREIDPDTHVCYIFNPYPGTKLYEESLAHGFLDRDYAKHTFVHRTDTPLRMPQFTRSQILKAYRNFSFKVYGTRAPLKALAYKVYYSRYGERLIRLGDPLKKLLQRLVMERKKERKPAA